MSQTLPTLIKYKKRKVSIGLTIFIYFYFSLLNKILLLPVYAYCIIKILDNIPCSFFVTGTFKLIHANDEESG